jgi:hypothetical protein
VTITRVGTNAKYADGWDSAFGKKPAGGAKKPGKAAAKKKSPKKAGKKIK